MVNPYLQRKLELQRFAKARKLVADQVAAIERQVRKLAEARAIRTIGGKSYCFGRGSTTWRPTHERAYEAHRAHLFDVRAPEFRALERKLQRQDDAIEAFRRKHGLNIDAAELVGRNLQFEFEENDQ